MIFFIFMYYFEWFSWVISVILLLSIYFFIFSVIYFAFSKLFTKKLVSFKEIFIRFMYRFALFFSLTIIFLWMFFYYQNKINPAKLPEYTLSNWKKTVVFQTMAHIWSDDFYNKIIQNISKRKKDWFVLFFEWVKPWNEENMNKFNLILWVNFDKSTYTNLSKLYWLRAQDNEEFLWIINNRDFNVDISIDEIIEKYTSKNIESSKQLKIPIDIEKGVDEIVNNLSDNEMKLLVYINRWIMNFIIKNDFVQDFATEKLWKTDIFEVILNDRNNVVSDNVIKSDYDKIYVLYWLMHFRWVLENLQKNDKSWKIASINYYYPIK